MSYFGYPEYISVAEKRRRAKKEVAQLRKKGRQVNPVVIEGIKLAETFWGKAWCKHLDGFADYETRLPRGRNYVRAGAVCHLEINPGRIDALVMGTNLYEVSIEIKPLPLKRWNAVKESCQGQINDLLGLLRGKLPKAVLSRLCDEESGLFPQSREIKFSCSCPDWAAMCKHVAATLYGVGNRLDTNPQLLFELRQVDAAELLTPETALTAVLGEAPTDTSSLLQTDDLGGLFGIELDGVLHPSESPSVQPVASSKKKPSRPQKQKSSKPRRVSPPPSPLPICPPLPVHPLGSDIIRLRELSGKTEYAFAAALGVSEATVRRWENSVEPLRLQASSRKGLERLQKKLERAAQK